MIPKPLFTRLALVLAYLVSLAGFRPVRTAHAKIGTMVPNAQMPTPEGGKAQVLASVEANVLVFLRPNQQRSLSALHELAQCQSQFAGKSVRWLAIVSSSAPPEGVASLMRDTRFAAPVLIDSGDVLYASLGLAQHPAVVIVGRDQKLLAFEPFRSLNYGSVVCARIRHLLREITEDELRQVLGPPRSPQGGSDQVAQLFRKWENDSAGFPISEK